MSCFGVALQLLNHRMGDASNRRRMSIIVGGLLICGVVAAKVSVMLVDFEAQVARKQEQLFAAVEGREWGDLERLLAASYSDRWGLGAGEVKRAIMGLRRQFLLLDIVASQSAEITLERAGGRLGAGSVALVRQVVRVEGRGGPFCEQVMARANALAGPFEFKWEKTGLWPGSWRLLTLDHGALQISADEIERMLEWQESY